MILDGNLQFDNHLFAFEETNIYGIYENEGYMTWHIELFPQGEDNYIMLNSLLFENVFSPRQLTNLKFTETAETADLYGHTIRVNGIDRFLKSVEMEFGNWDAINQSIQLIGHGAIEADDDLPEITYKFNAVLKFKELNIFETTKDATQKFIDTYLQAEKDTLNVKYENTAGGLQAIISGSF